MLGFTYNNIHSNIYNLYMKSNNRTLSPSTIKKEVELPNLNGTYDQYNNIMANRTIELDIKYIGTNLAELRTRARDIAKWIQTITGTKTLRFDDEPDKYYNVRIFDEVGLNNLFVLGNSTLQFECETFAYSAYDDYDVEKLYNQTWQYDDSNAYDNHAGFDFVLPFQMSGMNNYSNMKSQIEIVISGNVTGPYTILHNETGLSIERTANITVGRTYINNFELVSGSNSFSFGSSYSSAYITFSWSHNWL